jgi:hypothetical protein
LEIVGDGYVVVSGLPKENGLKHGTEICKMALELMHQVHLVDYFISFMERL